MGGWGGGGGGGALTIFFHKCEESDGIGLSICPHAHIIAELKHIFASSDVGKFRRYLGRLA